MPRLFLQFLTLWNRRNPMLKKKNRCFGGSWEIISLWVVISTICLFFDWHDPLKWRTCFWWIEHKPNIETTILSTHVFAIQNCFAKLWGKVTWTWIDWLGRRFRWAKGLVAGRQLPCRSVNLLGDYTPGMYIALGVKNIHTSTLAHTSFAKSHGPPFQTYQNLASTHLKRQSLPHGPPHLLPSLPWRKSLTKIRVQEQGQLITAVSSLYFYLDHGAASEIALVLKIPPPPRKISESHPSSRGKLWFYLKGG